MSSEIALVLAVLLVAIVLFVTEKLRVDLVALLVLLTLAISGAISHDDALLGFSNHAVVTIAAVLVLSGGLHPVPEQLQFGAVVPGEITTLPISLLNSDTTPVVRTWQRVRGCGFVRGF